MTKTLKEAEIMDTQIDIILQGGQFKKLLEEQSTELREKYNMKRAELEILYFLSKLEILNYSIMCLAALGILMFLLMPMDQNNYYPYFGLTDAWEVFRCYYEKEDRNFLKNMI